MSSMPAPHPAEFRQRAVELARTGDKPVAMLAKELRISESCLRNLIAQADADDFGGADRLTTAEKKELAELRRSRARSMLDSRDGTVFRCCPARLTCAVVVSIHRVTGCPARCGPSQNCCPATCRLPEAGTTRSTSTASASPESATAGAVP